MGNWKDQRAHERELDIGARLARKWVNMNIKIQCMSEFARQEFDRILDNLTSAANEEMEGGPVHGNSMGGPNPGEPPNGSDNNHRSN